MKSLGFVLMVMGAVVWSVLGEKAVTPANDMNWIIVTITLLLLFIGGIITVIGEKKLSFK